MVPVQELNLRSTPIPGLVLLKLPVHGDRRGWFKENWHRGKMTALGLPDFGPVQNNISYNSLRGTTRGIHAEPWDKFISLASGRIFGAWVDLRKGPTFGTLFYAELTPEDAVFVPRGVGNAFQTLENDTAYAYLVNDHWSPEAQAEYTFLNLNDQDVAVPWPIPLEDAVVSPQDRSHPGLSEVVAMGPRLTLVLGADGQVGKALRQEFDGDPAVEFADRTQFDIADSSSYRETDWKRYSTIINAAAFTAVDAAETEAGRSAAWKINAAAVSRLASTAVEHSLTLVHVSSDYVFDGSVAEHLEDEAPSPLGVYGQSKAAGDAAVSAVQRHYVVRCSWVVGDGQNFVRTMARLAGGGVSPLVVDDQWGRLTFASDIAAAIRHLLETGAAAGTYNLSSDGKPQTWAGVARDVYRLCGADPDMIKPISTADYAKPGTAPRPRNSVLDLSKIRHSGFTPPQGDLRLQQYLEARQLL
ncbi:bifunctional dTDP-4-dehydrorhamnose 3,5-epimerase family protein/NAD(P)-dependent oxidoreductase [Paenarthrobacter nitroguajacolicus]|uniref:bifunctional dTDP-4-dehydrorhamnose 3,5-epimerase family protein/NAD(P)-dependent oxidoreductase n=1 Tax=Paenarthrobacter nitroguajacolicus TaxID=211146 RepID=UPI00341626D9